MGRKVSSDDWTGKVPPDSYYRAWANRLGVSTPLGFSVRLGVLAAVGLVWWVTHA